MRYFIKPHYLPIAGATFVAIAIGPTILGARRSLVLKLENKRSNGKGI